jgi:hypothetical protein
MSGECNDQGSSPLQATRVIGYNSQELQSIPKPSIFFHGLHFLS